MGDDEVELANRRQGDFIEAYVSMTVIVVVLAILSLGVASYQYKLHIGLIDGLTAFLAWAYLYVMAFVTAMVLGIIFVLPLFFVPTNMRHMSPTERIAYRFDKDSTGLRNSGINFRFESLVNVLIYPASFYFSGHSRISVAILVMAFIIVATIAGMKKLGPLLVRDHYDYE